MNSIKSQILILSTLLILLTSAVFAETTMNRDAETASRIKLATNKTKFVAGDTIEIKGEGFAAFEVVSVRIETYDESLGQSLTLAQWNVFTDAKGRALVNLPFDSLTSRNGVYTIKVFGTETKSFAQKTITQEGTGINPAKVAIIKDAQPNSPLPFNFTTTGQAAWVFSLTDNGVVGPDRFFIDDLYGFGPENSLIVTEQTTNGYSLVAINCVSMPDTPDYPTSNNNIVNLQSRTVEIILEEGEGVECTFINAITTAASAPVAGRTVTDSGNPLARTRVTIQNTRSGETQTTYTNSFGRYQFDGLTVGDFYVVTVSNRKYVFEPNTQGFNLEDAIDGLDFTATTP